MVTGQEERTAKRQRVLTTKKRGRELPRERMSTEAEGLSKSSSTDTTRRKPGRPRQVVRLEAGDIPRLQAKVAARMNECYAETTRSALESVIRRSSEFRTMAQRLDPSIPDELASRMWIEQLIDAGSLSGRSADQYCTLLQMSRISGARAYRKGLKGLFCEYDRREESTAKTPQGEEVIRQILAFRKGQLALSEVALIFQWSTGCRFVDMARIRRRHIKDLGHSFLITLVGGKTDSKKQGQPLLLDKQAINAAIFGRFVTWLDGMRPLAEEMFFGTLTRPSYNTFLTKLLGCTSHFIRHSALTFVANTLAFSETPMLTPEEDRAIILPELVARNLARHKTEFNISFYIARETTAAARGTAPAMAILQKML
jgi:hypothetical protein